MSSWVSLLLFGFVLILNSCFIAAEIALLTSKKSRLQKKAANGSVLAKTALRLYNSPERVLSTILVGITSANVLSGLIVGESAADHLTVVLADVPYIGQYSKAIASFVMVALTTCTMVFSELVPKRIAMLHPEKAALVTSYVMSFFHYIFYPAVYMLNVATDKTLKMFDIKESKQELSAEEFKLLLKQVESHGAIEQTETDMIRRLLNLSDMQVGAVMTPRSQMISLDLADSNAINKDKVIKNPFNYFPVTDGGIQNVIGVVAVKQFLGGEFNHDNLRKYALSKPLFYIPEMAKLTNLMKMFRDKQTRIAIVIDEYGGVEGIVTLNDILKTFVGDLATLADGQNPTVVKKGEGYYIVSGSISVEEVMELIGVNSLPGEDEEEYRTLASFILKQLNRVPRAHDSFAAVGWTFKVLRMDKFRIAKVAITKNHG